MIISIYILQLNNGKYYTGITKNLDKRINQHEKARCRSTRKFLPCKLIYFAEADGYKNARRQEKLIKNRGAKRFLLEMKYR